MSLKLSIKQYAIIGLDNGLVLNRQKWVIWTNGGLLYWSICITQSQWVNRCYEIITQRNYGHKKEHFVYIHLSINMYHIQIKFSTYVEVLFNRKYKYYVNRKILVQEYLKK